MANDAPISLEQLFRFYQKGLPHQMAAIQELEQDLKENGYSEAMKRSRPWFATWSQDGKIADIAPAVQLCKEFEGFYPASYPDPLSGGEPWTIGFGSTRYADGRKVQRGDRISTVEADRLLRHELEKIYAKLASVIPYWNEMSTNQRCSLCSFAYNLGSAFYGSVGFETLSRALKDKRWKDVPGVMLLYRNPGTNVEAGLKRRRIAEGNLWHLGMAGK